MLETDLELFPLLKNPTPQSWLDAACLNVETLLIDHANCEKKAAMNALVLMNAYSHYNQLALSLSKLAREELKHFEQVHALISKMNMQYHTLSASRYASVLRANIARGEPDRLIDQLLIAGIIEARSCERFMSLSPHLDSDMSIFYKRLYQAEYRHYVLYLDFARDFSKVAIDERLEQLLIIEDALIMEPDKQFRFHSGIPC